MSLCYVIDILDDFIVNNGFYRVCLPFIFAMKNEKNRPFFKEKTQADSHFIRQVFDAEKQDLAMFHAKTVDLLLKIFKL
ncbi:MAG: hypothetical protein Q4D68_03090 [Moraxella equi]|nr:hypothetical protein [Moraxella equi]